MSKPKAKAKGSNFKSNNVLNRASSNGFGRGVGKGPQAEVQKAKDLKGTTKKLVNNYLSKYKVALLIVLIFSVGSTIFSVIGPKILGNATTEIFNRISK